MKTHSRKKLPIGTIRKVKDAYGNFRKHIKLPNHPATTNKSSWVIHARWVMELHLNRFLKSNDIVHHINGNTLDDRVQNLRVFESKRQHFIVHKNTVEFLSIDDISEFAVDFLGEGLALDNLETKPCPLAAEPRPKEEKVLGNMVNCLERSPYYLMTVPWDKPVSYFKG